MAVPGSRSGNRGEGQGYPRPGSNRPANAGASQYNRRPSEEQTSIRPPAPVPAPALRPTPPPPTPAANGGLLTDEIRELIQLMAASDLTEINIENGSQKILIKREPPRVVMQEYAPAPARGPKTMRAVSNSGSAPVEIAPISDPGSPPEDSFHKVTAPMVGTFYRSADPKGKPFVQEGDTVEKGQVIGIIEAMKIMNEIQSDHAGRCLRVTVENGQPVEYGQTLIVLEPA